MTNKMALEVLKSWLAVAYQNTDGTDASSAELYEALQTIFHLINIQHEQIEKLQEVVFKQEETMQLIGLEKQQYFDELQTAKSEIERLNTENNKNFDKWNILEERTKKRYAELYQEAKSVIRAEAVKEFVERLKDKSLTKWDYHDAVDIEEIDNLVKEMVGDKE